MNHIRKERTKELYIDITCDLIRTEGMKEVSIRKISEKAGYNSATLYSYFKNLSHLVLQAQLRFEDELCQLLQAEVKKSEGIPYYTLWPHQYAVMMKYYLEHPNIFDCAFVANFEKGEAETMLAERKKQSHFQQYIGESLLRIAKETSTDSKKIYEINALCLSQVVGTVLLFSKGRFTMDPTNELELFEKKITSMIHHFMEVDHE